MRTICIAERLRSRQGFTLAEALIVALIAVLILTFMYQLFFAGVKQTVKGTERLVTMQDAASLFAAIRQDLLGCTMVVTRDAAGGSVFHVLRATTPDFPPVSSLPQGAKVEFGFAKVATASYVALPADKCILRVETGPQPSIRKFALPRLHRFQALVLLQEHSLRNSPMDTRHLLVELELEPDRERPGAKPVRMFSVFSPPNLGLSAWNFQYID